jgi:RNA polymerase sigma-70 factor (ECF subfamily)
LYSDDVYRFLVHFTGSKDVEDLVQETFIRAMRGLHSYRAESSPKTWLLRIARNLAIDANRRKKKAKYVSDDILLSRPSSEKTPHEFLEISETTRLVLDLLQQVNPKYRDVLLLRGIHDLSSAEVARILGWPQSRVNVTYHRAIQTAHRLIAGLAERSL